jgi:hypothetical protein
MDWRYGAVAPPTTVNVGTLVVASCVYVYEAAVMVCVKLDVMPHDRMPAPVSVVINPLQSATAGRAIDAEAVAEPAVTA